MKSNMYLKKNRAAAGTLTSLVATGGTFPPKPSLLGFPKRLFNGYLCFFIQDDQPLHLDEEMKPSSG